MLFKLTNILIIFQKYIKTILRKKFNIFIGVYLNDILIYIKIKMKSYIKQSNKS